MKFPFDVNSLLLFFINYLVFFYLFWYECKTINKYCTLLLMINLHKIKYKNFLCNYKFYDNY